VSSVVYLVYVHGANEMLVEANVIFVNQGRQTCKQQIHMVVAEVSVYLYCILHFSQLFSFEESNIELIRDLLIYNWYYILRLNHISSHL